MLYYFYRNLLILYLVDHFDVTKSLSLKTRQTDQLLSVSHSILFRRWWRISLAPELGRQTHRPIQRYPIFPEKETKLKVMSS